MREAIRQSLEGMERNEGGPFGAIVVKDGKIVGRGNLTGSYPATTLRHTLRWSLSAMPAKTWVVSNWMIVTFTPPAEPCPMCLGAIYWARPKRVFGCTRNDAADIQFDDAFIYDEMTVPLEQRKIPMIPLLRDEAPAWRA